MLRHGIPVWLGVLLMAAMAYANCDDVVVCSEKVGGRWCVLWGRGLAIVGISTVD